MLYKLIAFKGTVKEFRRWLRLNRLWIQQH